MCLMRIQEWPRRGFRNILTMLLKVKRGGCLVGGPPCGSWVWINSATHKRKRDHIFGDTKLAYVRDATASLGQISICFLQVS